MKPINFLKIKFPFPGQTDQRIEKNSVKSIKFFRKLNFRFRSVSGIENSILKKSVKLMSPYCVLTSARRFAIIEAIGKYRRGKHRRGDQLSVDEANIDEADIGKFYVSSFFGWSKVKDKYHFAYLKKDFRSIKNLLTYASKIIIKGKVI